MSKQIELALLSLMPSFGADLPSTLVETASSLLAQSRHLASTLKADEEVARLYACAHIACDRQKITLDLPPIQPRPPIPPRVYKRLYTHLDSILPNAAANNRRGKSPRSKTRSVDASPGGSQKRPLPSRPTPSREASLASFRKQNSNAGTPTKAKGQLHTNVRESGLYQWVQPVIRHLCVEPDNRKLAPSMLAGMESILIPGGRLTNDNWALRNATAICAAIIFFVVVRVKDIPLDQALSLQGLTSTRQEILDQLSRARAEVTADSGSEDDAYWQGWSEIGTEDFDVAMARVHRNGWLDADWYTDIAAVVQDDQLDIADPEDEDMESAVQMQTSRADTMMQEKYDLLSEGRRLDYQVWKQYILAKIEDKMTKC